MYVYQVIALYTLNITVLFVNDISIKLGGKSKKTGTCHHMYEPYLNLFGLLQQSTTDWVVYRQQVFIFHSSGVCRSEIKASAWLDEGRFLNPRLPTLLERTGSSVISLF